MAIKNLYDLYQQKSSDFIEKLMNSNVVIDDNVNGSFFSVKKSLDGWVYYKKGSQITLIERTISRFYEDAIKIFESIPEEKRESIPDNIIFVFKYITEGNSNELRIPKDILKLTHIYDITRNQNLNDIETLNSWADTLGVGRPPILFNGILNDEQKEGIMSFVYTNQAELSKRFKSESFTKYILSLLNPEYESNGIDSIVFRFTDENDEQILAKYIDPLFYDISSTNAKQEAPRQNDSASIIIVNLMNFIDSYQVSELSSVVHTELPYEKNYVALMNKVFLDYIKINYADLVDYKIYVPEHLAMEINDVNYAFIENQEVVDIINMNETFKEIYRILLNFFKKKRKKTNSVFSEDICKMFNALIEKLQKVVLGKSVYEKYYPSFNEFAGLISEEFNFNSMRTIEPMSRFATHTKRKAVNVIVDYFQPITNKHLAVANTLKNKNKLDTLFILIENKNICKTRPFSTDTAKKLISKVASDGKNECIAGVVVIDEPNIDNMLRSICLEYIPILWAASKSKIDEYKLQMEYARKRSTRYNIGKRFKLIVAPELSDRRILDFIETRNFVEFKKEVPKVLHSEFYNLVNCQRTKD